MASISDLVTTIIADTARSDTSISDIVLVDVLSSIREYEAQRFFFNEQKLTCTLSNTDTYALTLFAPAGVADVIEVDDLSVTANGNTYTMEEIGLRDINALSAANNTTGYPTRFSYFNQSLLIYPKASSNYLATLFGHVRFAEASISTSNVWSNIASDLIRNATLARLWGRRWKNPEAAQAAKSMERDALSALQRRTEALSGSRLSGYL